MASLQRFSSRRLGIAAIVLIAALVLAVTTAPRATLGASLRARAVVVAASASARLAGGGTLAAGARTIARSLAAPGVSVAVLGRQGRVLARSSSLPGLAPAIPGPAITAALGNADVRLSSGEGTHELVTALAPVGGKAGPGLIAVTGADRPSRTLSGTRALVILVCAALLAGLGVLAGWLASRRTSLASRSATQPRAVSAPRSSDQTTTAAELDQLIAACVDLVESAPTALAERVDEALSRAGVVRVDPTGERFDPNIHHAVERVATDRVDRHNVIAATVRPGYSGHGRVVREPEVAVYRHEGS